MNAKRIIALLLATVLCFQTGIILKQNTFAESSAESVHVHVSADPQEAVLGASVEMMSPPDSSGAIALKINTSLDVDYLDSKIGTYTKDIIDTPETNVSSDDLSATPSGEADEGSSDATPSGETDEGSSDTTSPDGENDGFSNATSSEDDVVVSPEQTPLGAETETTLTGREALDTLGGEQDIRIELDNLGDSYFPQITYSMILDGNVFSADENPTDTGEIYAGSNPIGSYSISEGEDGNPVLTAVLDRYVYYTAPSSVEYTVTVYLADDDYVGKTVKGVAIGDGSMLSLVFEDGVVNMAAAFAFIPSAGAVSGGNLKDIISGLAKPPYTITVGSAQPISINESIFSLLNMSVNAPSSDNSMQMSLECVFNETFLEKCWLAVGGYVPSVGLPNLSFDFTFNTNDVKGDPGKQYFKFDDNTLAFIVSDRNINIGEMTIKETFTGSGIYKFNITFYPQIIYGAGDASGAAFFKAWLVGTDRKTWKPEIVPGGAGEVLIEWDAPLNPNFTNNEMLSATKSLSTANSYTTPYIDYTLEFKANTAKGGDLRYLTIVDDLKQQPPYGLNALSFSYVITLDDNSTKEGKIDLPLDNATDITNKGQPYLYYKNSSAALTKNTFDPSSGLSSLTSITIDNLSIPENLNSPYGEAFILDVGTLINKLGVAGGKVVTNVKIELNTIMDTTAYQKYMNSSSGNAPLSADLTFKNSTLGFYNDGDTKKESVQSDDVTTPKINFTYFKKEGVRDVDKMKYTITAATYFVNNMGDVYIVDRINSDQHTLDTNSVVLIPGGKLTPIPNVTDDLTAGIDLTKTYAQLRAMTDGATIDALNAMWGRLSRPTGTSPGGGRAATEAVYYTTGNEQIVIYRIGSALVNKPLTLNYDTTIMQGSYDQNNIQNDAMIVVKNNYLGGRGPGGTILQDPIGTLNKSVGIDYKIASKVPASTTASSVQNITWNINFNTALEPLKNIVVLDEIDSTKMVLSKLGNLTPSQIASGAALSLSNGPVLTYVTPAEFDTNKKLTSTTAKPSDTGNYYTYEKTAEKEILKFYFAELNKISPYVTLTTTVIDAGVLAGNSSTVTNTLKAWCWDGVTRKSQPDIIAERTVTIPKISKALVAGYNYADGSMNWTIKANTAATKLNIQNMVVTDFLPQESYLSKITKIMYDGAEYTITGETEFNENTTQQQSGTLKLTKEGAATLYLKVIVEPSQDYATLVANKLYSIVRFIVSDVNGAQADIVLDKQLDISIETKFKESYKKGLDFNSTLTPRYTNRTTLDGVVGFNPDPPNGTFSYPPEGTIDKTALTALATALGTTLDKAPLGATKGYYDNGNKKAKASAYTDLEQFRPMLKTATYKQNGVGGYIGADKGHWTLVVNRDMYNNAPGATITDKVNPDDPNNPGAMNGKGWFMLEKDTMKVSTVTLDPTTGEWDYTPSGIGDIYVAATATGLGPFTRIDESGFEFVIPQNKVYVIEYDTTVIATETLYFRNITNTAEIDYHDGRTGSYTGNAGGVAGNVAHAYASINYLPNLYVVKSHRSTTVNPYTFMPNLRLDGVTFTLTGYEYNPVTKVVNYNKVEYPERDETTELRGSAQVGGNVVSAMFPLLSRSNIVYVLKEKSLGSYDGTYNIDAKPRYFRVVSNRGDVNYNISETISDENGKPVLVEVITTNAKVMFYDDTSNVTGLEDVDTGGHVVADSLTDGKYYATAVMFDTLVAEPDTSLTGRVEGLKVGLNKVTGTETVLANALFGLYINYGNALNPNKMGIAHSASNRFGEFAFQNLNPGTTYYLRELYSPAQKYDMSGMLDPNDSSKINPEKIITFTVPVGATDPVTMDDSGAPIKVVNEEILVKGEIVGYKVSSNNAPLVGATFGLFRNKNFSATPLKTATSALNAQGRAEFRFNDFYVNGDSWPVEYYIRELSAPTGYVRSDVTYTVAFAEPSVYDKDAVEIIEQDKNGVEILFVNHPRTQSSGGGGGGGGGGRTVTPPVTPPVTPLVMQTIIPPELPPVTPPVLPPVTPILPPVTPPTVQPTAPTPPVLSEVPESEIIHPAQLPNNYSAVKVGDNTYVIYEDEIPLGYVIVPDGMTLDDIDIMDELIPLGLPEFPEEQTIKKNPVTRDMMYNYFLVSVVLMLALTACIVLRRRFKKNIL